ncbi:MAG: CoA synthetase [Ectothiorhodospiraceae bacterium]|nr:CoA synthetase [Chromatiales bacterium]MCP5153647.1 CoA synthetase [Ectothiorhodospiraceae bacterium]
MTAESAATLAARVPDGACIALAPDYSGCSIATILALAARGARELHLVAVPQLGFQGDVLIGAGCVGIVEAAAVSLGEQGAAPRFQAALRAGTIEMRDATCPAIHAALQAAEKGAPFMPLRGVIGSDLVPNRPDWKVIDNPFGVDDPVLVVPALAPDVALLHAPMADREGNVWIGIRRELMLMAHAARRTLVTVEEIVDGRLLDDPALAAGTIPALYVEAVACVPAGARPNGLFGRYPPDRAALAAYAEMARTEEGFAAWLGRQLATPEAVGA